MYGRLDKPRSKYFQKHYLVEEADCWPVQCPSCKCIFEIDFKWTKTVMDTEDGKPSEQYYCPYCRRRIVQRL